ncbi:MAG: hypothetical protein HY866_23920 [Chloroflexi bacterium]|nr:hypothetical protein [Chloroflexota bacterium]
MDHKQMCVANLKYKKPTEADSKKAKGLLRYLTYRDSRDGHIKQMSGQERWVDHGLGHTVGEIAETCDSYQSEHVLAFTLVFNPNPNLLSMVPEKRRGRFVRELTENTLDQFFEARGLDTGIEFAYVTHHRVSEDPQAPGLPDPHTHVILPGTYFDEGEGRRVPLFFSRNKQVDHIELLHQITEKNMAEGMERYVGLDWERRYDALEAAREQQRKVVEREPDGEFFDDRIVWPVWAGVRRMTEDTSAAGIYRYFPVAPTSGQTEFEPDELRLEFRPLLQLLDHGLADTVAQAFAYQMRAYPDPSLTKLEDYARQLVEDAQADSGTRPGLDIQREGPSFDL